MDTIRNTVDTENLPSYKRLLTEEYWKISDNEFEAVIEDIIEDVKEGKLMPEEVNEACIERYLDTHDIPDPDLLIRTSGEQRLSNYLLWQLAYTEFYFTDVPWPDFSKQELEKAIEQYNRRDRRYGGVKEE